MVCSFPGDDSGNVYGWFAGTLAHDAEPVSVAKSVTMCIVKLDV